MIFELATFKYPLYTMRVLLDGRDYLLTFDYSAREDRWYMSIADSEEVPIYSGIKLLPNVRLLARCADRRKPPGEIMVEGATFETLKLVYYDKAELDAVFSAVR